MKASLKKADLIDDTWLAEIQRLEQSITDNSDHKRIKSTCLSIANFIDTWIKRIPTSAPTVSSDIIEHYSSIYGETTYQNSTQAEKAHITERLQQLSNFAYEWVCHRTNKSIKDTIKLLSEPNSENHLRNTYQLAEHFKQVFLQEGVHIPDEFQRRQIAEISENNTAPYWIYQNHQYDLTQSEGIKKRTKVYDFTPELETRQTLLQIAPNHLTNFIANMRHTILGYVIYDAMGKLAPHAELLNTVMVDRAIRTPKEWALLQSNKPTVEEQPTSQLLTLAQITKEIKGIKNQYSDKLDTYYHIYIDTNKSPSRIGYQYQQNHLFQSEYQVDINKQISVKGSKIASTLTKKKYHTNKVSDALFDLAYICGFAPNHISLNDLTISLGSEPRQSYKKGTSKLAGYYTTHDKHIHIKSSQVACLAHEWFHAFDHATWEKWRKEAPNEEIQANLLKTESLYYHLRKDANQEESSNMASEVITLLLNREQSREMQPFEINALKYLRQTYPNFVTYIQNIMDKSDNEPRTPYTSEQKEQLFMQECMKELHQPDTYKRKLFFRMSSTFLQESIENCWYYLATGKDILPDEIQSPIYLGYLKAGGLYSGDVNAGVSAMQSILNQHSKEVVYNSILQGMKKLIPSILSSENIEIIMRNLTQYTQEIEMVFQETITQFVPNENDVAEAIKEQQTALDEQPTMHHQILAYNISQSIKTKAFHRHHTENHHVLTETKEMYKQVGQIFNDNLQQRLLSELPTELAFIAYSVAQYANQHTSYNYNLENYTLKPTAKQMQQMVDALKISRATIMENIFEETAQEDWKKQPPTKQEMWRNLESRDHSSNEWYYQQPIEIFARTNEAIVQYLMQEQGFKNPLLTEHHYSCSNDSVYPSTNEVKKLSQLMLAMLHEQLGDYRMEWANSVKNIPIINQIIMDDRTTKIELPVSQDILDKHNPLNPNYIGFKQPQQGQHIQPTQEKPQKTVSLPPENQMSFNF